MKKVLTEGRLCELSGLKREAPEEEDLPEIPATARSDYEAGDLPHPVDPTDYSRARGEISDRLPAGSNKYEEAERLFNHFFGTLIPDPKDTWERVVMELPMFLQAELEDTEYTVARRQELFSAWPLAGIDWDRFHYKNLEDKMYTSASAEDEEEGEATGDDAEEKSQTTRLGDIVLQLYGWALPQARNAFLKPGTDIVLMAQQFEKENKPIIGNEAQFVTRTNDYIDSRAGAEGQRNKIINAPGNARRYAARDVLKVAKANPDTPDLPPLEWFTGEQRKKYEDQLIAVYPDKYKDLYKKYLQSFLS